MDLYDHRPIIFTAQSKRDFFCRDAICEFVFGKECVPLNPFRAFDYFLGDRVERNLVRQANFNLLRLADELWVFGNIIANGVFAEVQYALELQKPIRFFTVAANAGEIREIDPSKLKIEREGRDEVGGRNKLLEALRHARPTDEVTLF